MKHFYYGTGLLLLIALSSCTTARVTTFIINKDILTELSQKPEQVTLPKVSEDNLNPEDLKANNLFKLSEVQSYNVGKWKPAVASDFGFNPDSNKNLMKVQDRGFTAWLTKPNGKKFVASSQSSFTGFIIPSQVLTDNYLKNPFNMLALIGSLSEGHGSTNNKVFIHNPAVAKHGDPGSQKGDFPYNVGSYSGQKTDKTGSHKAIFALTGNSLDLDSQIKVFKSGLYQDANREYTTQMIEGFKRHEIWNKKLSIPAFVNVVDTFVQNGTGRVDGHKTNLFLTTYFKIKDYNRSQIVDFLKSKRVDSSDLEGGYGQMSDESLKVFAARMNVFVDSAITRDEFCFNQPTCGMGKVNALQNGYLQRKNKPTITWTASVANDQYRRQQALIFLVSIKDMKNLANAKVSAIPDGK